MTQVRCVHKWMRLEHCVRDVAFGMFAVRANEGSVELENFVCQCVALYELSEIVNEQLFSS